MPVFGLVVAKGGPKMKPDSTPGDAVLKTGNGRGVLTATRVGMPALAGFLNDGQTGRPVKDMTGLTGKFDFRLEWTPDPSLGGAPGGARRASRSGRDFDFFTASQQQLGAAARSDHRTGGLFCGDARGVAIGELTCLLRTGVLRVMRGYGGVNARKRACFQWSESCQTKRTTKNGGPSTTRPIYSSGFHRFHGTNGTFRRLILKVTRAAPPRRGMMY